MKSKIVNTENGEFKELLTLLPFTQKDYEKCLDQMYLDGQIGEKESYMTVEGRNMRIHWTKVSKYHFEYSGCSIVNVGL